MYGSECKASDITGYRSELFRKRLILGALMAALLAVIAVFRIAQGEWDIPLRDVLYYLSPFLPGDLRSTPEALVVRAVRLPRFLSAAGAGGLLCVAGVVLQGLLANPLAEPYTLGIAAGAAFGGALGFFLGTYFVAPMSFAGAALSLWMVSVIAWKGGKGRGEYLILAGIITNAVLSAGVTFLKAIADEKLGAIVLWLMGSLAGASPGTAVTVWLAALPMLGVAFLYGRELDAISLGGGQGELLGVDEKKLRMILLCAASVATAAAVSCFGIIGFVGLVVPHLLRLAIGPSHRPLLALSFITGACLLSLADGLAQSMGELPVGVITALLGGPFFCMLLIRGKTGRVL